MADDVLLKGVDEQCHSIIECMYDAHILIKHLQILVILLTGKSKDDVSVPSDQIKKAGISKVIVVGIGRVPAEDLKNTATNPQNALVCPSYPQLQDRIPDVIALINAGNYNAALQSFIQEICESSQSLKIFSAQVFDPHTESLKLHSI